jgi:hypothetical protein
MRLDLDPIFQDELQRVIEERKQHMREAAWGVDVWINTPRPSDDAR